MHDTIGQVLEFIGSWADPVRALPEDVRDPIMIGFVLGLGALIAIGAWKKN